MIGGYSLLGTEQWKHDERVDVNSQSIFTCGKILTIDSLQRRPAAYSNGGHSKVKVANKFNLNFLLQFKLGLPKWDKKTKNNEMVRDEANEWIELIYEKKVEQVNDNLFVNTWYI